MDTQIEDFNWNLRLFLDVLSSYETKVNKANPATLELLEKTLDTIASLLDGVNEVPANKNDAIVCSLDGTTFEIQRTIFCRICNVNFVASRIDYLLHLSEPGHNAKLLTKKNVLPIDSNNNNNNSTQGKDDPKSLAVKNDSPNSEPKFSPGKSLYSSLLEMMEEGSGDDDAGAFHLNEGFMNENRTENISAKLTSQMGPSEEVSKVLPNVFDDDIYNFLQSMTKKQSNEDWIRKRSNATSVDEIIDAMFMVPPCDSTASNPSKKLWPKSDRPAMVRQDPLLSWRERPIVQPATVPEWRVKKPETDSVPGIGDPINQPSVPNPIATAQVSVPTTSAASQEQPTVSCPPVPEISVPITKSIIYNGAVLTGPGVKPCPTYDLNNLYVKFPYLNANKVANPLVPVPLADVKRSTQQKPDTSSQKMAGRLQELFDKVNATRGHGNGIQKSELTNSLLSLPNFLATNVSSTTEQTNAAARRMPERSASSINLDGISKMTGAYPQKVNRKSSPNELNGNYRQNNRNENRQSNSQNRNNGPKSKGGRYEIPLNTNDAKGKGAIPKQQQQAKNTNQTPSNRRESQSNAGQNKTNSAQNAQKKDLNQQKPVNVPKNTQIRSDAKETTESVNEENLKKLFTGDLSALLNLLVSFNLRPEKIVKQKQTIELIESTLKEKFPKVKCHLMGSQVYNIAKGGLATFDVYLDLFNTYTIDKSGPVFVAGMNDVQKILDKSGDWSDTKCSDQTRYAILSAVNKAKNLKCNFTFGTGVAVRNTDVINTLFAAQPVARQLVICIRLALQDGSNGDWDKQFTGYIVTLLVVFYLQIAGKLPSVVSLQSDPNLEIMKCGENMVHFQNPKNVAICKDRIRDLLIGFFDYYEKFDYGNKIISPFEGREINQNFRNCPVDSLSRTMRRFKSLIDAEPQRWTNNKMCIQDIFEHKNNVGQAIHIKEMKAFREFCLKSLVTIRAAGSSVKY